jgi:hypothetical protein
MREEEAQHKVKLHYMKQNTKNMVFPRWKPWKHKELTYLFKDLRAEIHHHT